VTPADRALLERLAADVAAVRALLERRRPDPEGDARLVHALASTAGSRVFAAPDVLRRARVDPALGKLLEAGGVRTSRQIGQALRRCRDRDLGGFTVERIKRDERGAMWSIRPTVSGVQHTGA
jgi:hypothetical protein